MITSATARRLVLLLAFVSGAAALGHEIVWTRLLADVFGTTAGAAAVVLACFMAGMGAGGWYFGRIADRVASPLRLYGRLEIAAAVLAALVPLVVWLTGFPYGVAFRAFGPSATFALVPLRILLAAVALVPPAFALGGTLPALVRHLATSDTSPDDAAVASVIGTTSAVNTAGAVCGCALTGFVLIQGLGVMFTTYLAAAVSAAVGVGAILLDRRIPLSAAPSAAPEETEKGHEDSTSRALARWIAPSLYALSGFAALGLEVLWTRSLVFLLRATVYAFTSMLTVFLLGLAIGNALGSYLARTMKRTVLVFAAIEAALAVVVALGLFILRAFASDWDALDLMLSQGWSMSALLHLAVSGTVMLVPTILFGAAFPVLGRLQSRQDESGAATGRLYFGNTVGAVAGSLAAAFVVVPLLGTGQGILLCACISLTAAALSILLLVKTATPLKVRIAAAPLLLGVVAFVAMPADATSGLFAAPIARAEMVFLQEDPGGTITVHRYPDSGWHVLSAGGVQVAGEAPALRSTQILQGLIPVLLHPDPESVLQVGLGSGETAHVALMAGAKSLRCVEIAPGVIEAAGTYFTSVNHGVLDDDRFEVVVCDGKNYLAHASGTYDIILSESTYPFLSGSSGLYTRDYFERIRSRLAPGGLVSIWLPLDVPAAGVKSILATFADVFPFSTLWTTNTYAYKHGLLLGAAEPFKTRLTGIKDHMARSDISSLLRSVGIHSPTDFMSGLMLDDAGLRRYAGGAILHTDDRPVLEYATSLRSGVSWRIRLADNMAAMGLHRAPLLAHVDFAGMTDEQRHAASCELARAELRARHLLVRLSADLRSEARVFDVVERARAAIAAGDTSSGLSLYRRALDIAPDDGVLLSEFGHVLLGLGLHDEARDLMPTGLRPPTE